MPRAKPHEHPTSYLSKSEFSQLCQQSKRSYQATHPYEARPNEALHYFLYMFLMLLFRIVYLLIIA